MKFEKSVVVFLLVNNYLSYPDIFVCEGKKHKFVESTQKMSNDILYCGQPL